MSFIIDITTLSKRIDIVPYYNYQLLDSYHT